nr:preprotein translocase subunit SecG [Kangiella sp. TOML190]
MQLFLMISLLVVALLLIGIILIQQGKGAEMGASFGAGGSNTLFGAPGAGNFLTKSTTVLAILFFVIALAITGIKNRGVEASNILDDAAEEVKVVTPDNVDSLNAIPSEKKEAVSTEIPTAAKETLATEIPTATEIKDTVKNEAAKTADAVKEKANDVTQDAEDKAKELKADTDKKIDEAKDAAEEAKKDLKEKADGDQ